MKAVFFFNHLKLYFQDRFKRKIVRIAIHFTFDRDIFHFTIHRLQLHPLYNHVGLSNIGSGKITERLRSVKRKQSQRANFDWNDVVFHDHLSLKTRKNHNNLCVEKRKKVTVSIGEELIGLSNVWCRSSFRSLLLGYITDSKARIALSGLRLSCSFKQFIPQYQNVTSDTKTFHCSLKLHLWHQFVTCDVLTTAWWNLMTAWWHFFFFLRFYMTIDVSGFLNVCLYWRLTL